MKPHEVIYLQNPDEDELEFWDETTWCSDKINEHDAKYMLASPLLEGAPDLLEAAKFARDLLKPELVKEPARTIFWLLVDAIAKAETQS